MRPSFHIDAASGEFEIDELGCNADIGDGEAIGRQELFVTNLLFEVVEQRRHLFVECLLDRDFVGLAVHEATPDHARKKIFAPVTGESPPSPNSSYQSACAYWYGSEGFRQGWRALVRPRV